MADATNAVDTTPMSSTEWPRQGVALSWIDTPISRLLLRMNGDLQTRCYGCYWYKYIVILREFSVKRICHLIPAAGAHMICCSRTTHSYMCPVVQSNDRMIELIIRCVRFNVSRKLALKPSGRITPHCNSIIFVQAWPEIVVIWCRCSIGCHPLNCPCAVSWGGSTQTAIIVHLS